jgi:CreA protein
MKAKLLLPALLLSIAPGLHAERIGEVDTVFKFIGPDHKIVVEVFDDPKVGGVSCYLSRAKTGGIKGAFGLAVCRTFVSKLEQQAGRILVIPIWREARPG